MTLGAFSSTHLVEGWDRFWFRQVPPHAYALLRVLFGIIGVVSVLGMTPVTQFWTPEGLFATPADPSGLKAQILSGGYGTVVGWAFFAGLLASFAALAAGFQTGAAIVLCFAGSVFQPFWNRLPLSSAHHVVVVVLFCLLWVDAGRVWSVDAWRARSDRTCLPEPAAEPIWPLRLIRFQVALIYLNSGLWKLSGEMWRDGSAVHYATSLNVFHRFPIEAPPVLDVLATLGTYVTLGWEIGFALLVLMPSTRWLALGLGALLHLGMGVTLELGPFSAIMIASYAAFLTPESVARVSWRTVASPWGGHAHARCPASAHHPPSAVERR